MFFSSLLGLIWRPYLPISSPVEEYYLHSTQQRGISCSEEIESKPTWLQIASWAFLLLVYKGLFNPSSVAGIKL